MLDPAFLRDDLGALRAALEARGADLSAELEELAALEAQRRRLLPELEGLKRAQNTAAADVARAKREGLDTAPIQQTSRERAQQIKHLEVELEAVEARRTRGMLVIPNVPHATVPVGMTA
jgi:seryl-tRNA synthetase